MLNELRLEGNRLSALPTNGFAKLSGLRILHLEHNQISILKRDAFNGLKRLVELHLNNNLIRLNSYLTDQENGQFNSSLLGDQNVNNETINEIQQSINNYQVHQPTLNTRPNQQFSSSHHHHPLSDETTTDKAPVDLRIEQLKIDHSRNALHISNFNELKFLDLGSNPLFVLNEFNSPFAIQSNSESANSGNRPTSSPNQLDTLLLNNCSLFKIDQNSFSQLTDLVKLNLNHNLLSVSDFS